MISIVRSRGQNDSTQRYTKNTITEWEERTPRFLFRGWKPSSGGNSGLNSKIAVVPHAFYGKHPGPPDKSILEIPEHKIRSEIEGHLTGSHQVKSHFSSWAADLSVALGFAGVGKDAHLAVFDTSLRGQHNEIYHVPALQAIGFSTQSYPEEYLVYGPVTGDAYTCVSVVHLRKQGMAITVGGSKGTPEVSVDDLTRARKIAKVFQPPSHAMGPDLFLTVFAAELSRLLRPAGGKAGSPGWSQKDNRAILMHLSDAVDSAAKLPPNKSLVNPKTYVDNFPQLKAMVDILMTVEVAINRKRTSTTSAPSASGQKRKIDESEASNCSKVSESGLQEALPRDLLEDCAGHVRIFQERLQIARNQLDPTTDGLGLKAKALKAKLIATEKDLEALSIKPKRNTLSAAILHMEKAASYLDGLTNSAQRFTTEIQHAEVYLGVLQQSCNGIIKSIGKEEDPFVRRGPQKPLHESTPARPLPPKKPEAESKQNQNSQNRTKRAKQKAIPSGQSDSCDLWGNPLLGRLFWNH